MIRQYPDIPAETLVSMKSFEIPVTEKNVKIFNGIPAEPGTAYRRNSEDVW